MSVNLVRYKKNGTPVFWGLQKGSTVIGRSRQCRLRIPVLSVSKKHCQIDVNADSVKISDLGSRNGTFVNSIPILEPHPINAGDIVKIEPVEFIFQINGQPKLTKKTAGEPETNQQAQPASDVTPSIAPGAEEETSDELENDLDFFENDFVEFEEDNNSMESNA